MGSKPPAGVIAPSPFNTPPEDGVNKLTVPGVVTVKLKTGASSSCVNVPLITVGAT